METSKERSRNNLKIKFFFLILFLFANFSRLSAQQAQVATDLKSFDWLIGTWKRETSHGITVEKWTKVSDLTFEGESLTIQNGIPRSSSLSGCCNSARKFSTPQRLPIINTPCRSNLLK